MCTEVCKFKRCQYLRHLWTQSQLPLFLTPAFGMSIELPVFIIAVRYFCEALLYRQNNFCKDTEIVPSKDCLHQNNNDARRVCSLQRPDRMWGLHGTPFNWYRCSLPGTKWTWREASHSPPSSTQLRSGWIYNFTKQEQLWLVPLP